MSWEDYERARREADRDAQNRQAWVLVACFVAVAVLLIVAKACS